MKILSYKKIKNNLYEITFDNLEKVKLYDEIILKENLLIKKEIEQTYLNEIIKQNSFYELYHDTIKFLKMKMRSEKEIYQKFNKKYSNKEIAKVILRLKQDGYLNDKEYITAYINDSVNLKLVGPDKIKKDLFTLGFDIEEVSNAVKVITEDVWYEKIKKYTDKMIKNNKKLSANALRQKIINDLIVKGFSRENINNYLNTINIVINNEIYRKEYDKLYTKLNKKYDGDRLKYELNIRLKAKGFGDFID
ncbi:MAG: RecX family transcriptional regulator [Bacilli bacterium]|nr:RecX family transcriptional regulator [Bacilli bacterium]